MLSEMANFDWSMVSYFVTYLNNGHIIIIVFVHAYIEVFVGI